tara:strand:- start:3715 stop:4074 length:360 start_codon:yes stop_codon:yes gene_type:complete
MAPVTRSMTLARRDTQTMLVEDERKEIMHEIRMGIHNVDYVKGSEYKKYMVYALFDYMCDVEPCLYALGKTFGRTMRAKLTDFSQHEDETFRDACLYYKEKLNDYFEWSVGTSKDGSRS